MPRAILCDIEGTLGSIHFVKEVLFPYAAEHLPDFVGERHSDPAVRAQLDAVAAECGIDPGDTAAIVARLLDWIELDNKATPLKALQGMVWEAGYRSGAYRAHVYEDAWQRLREWKEQGLELYVYSSGSVQAQELYFEYSTHGDIKELFSGYFDTTTGPKREPSSYAAIAAKIGLRPNEVLFLSDIGAELDAAAEAGMRTTWIIRPEDSSLDIQALDTEHRLAASFDDVGV